MVVSRNNRDRNSRIECESEALAGLATEPARASSISSALTWAICSPIGWADVSVSLEDIERARAFDSNGGNLGAKTLERHNAFMSRKAAAFTAPPAEPRAAKKPYKDLLAQVVTGQKSAQEKCGSFAQICHCSSGQHHFGKKIYCMQEWCPVCGKMESNAHKRRMARKGPKVRQLAIAGGLVIEFPRERRPGLRTKEALRDAVETCGNVLFGKHTRRGREGGYFYRGLEDWHFFNDEKPGHAASVFNPHMNFILDYPGALEPEELASLKDDLRTALDCPKLIVNYQFVTTPGQIFHLVRYNCRATFKNRDWDNTLADELYGLRKSRSWGNWNDEPVWNYKEAGLEDGASDGLAAVSKLQEHICPDCGAPLAVQGYKTKLNKTTLEREWVLDKQTKEPVPTYWRAPLPWVLMEASGAEEIYGGYYRLPAGWCITPDGEAPSPEEARIMLPDCRIINGSWILELRDEARQKRRMEEYSKFLLLQEEARRLAADG
jgi:hypothetical protein